MAALTPERAHEGHLNTILFLSFEKKGGMGSLLTVVERLFDTMNRFPSAVAKSPDESRRTEHVQAIAGIKIALLVLGALVSPKALLENAQTHVLQQRGAGQRASEKFSPVDIFVKTRLHILPVARKVWNADWLPESPSPIVKMAVKTFLTIMEAQNEEANDVGSSGAPLMNPPIPRPAPTADPARVDQLIDMGFAREAAEFALIREQNNVAAAADLILSMPHLFQAEIPPAEAAAPAVEVAEPPADEPTEPVSDLVEAPASGTDMEIDSHPDPPLPAARAELAQLREECHLCMASRAIILLDRAEDLVFDLIPAFPAGVDGVMYLLDRTMEIPLNHDGMNEQALSARFRLLAVRLRVGEGVSLNEHAMTRAAEVLSSVPLTSNQHPRWLPAFLLFAECVFALSTPVLEAKLGDDASTPVVQASQRFAELQKFLAKTCIDILGNDSTTREILMSALRLLVVLSRTTASGWDTGSSLAVLAVLRTPSAKLHGSQPLLAIIMRHAFEDEASLREVMRGEIRKWFSPARNKVTDINHFIRQLRQVALREPTVFLESVEKECALVDPTPPQSVYHIRAKEFKDKPPGVASDIFQVVGSDKSRQPIMDALLSELATAVRIAQGRPLDGSNPSLDDGNSAHSRAGLILSLLTELLGSYLPAKEAFMSSIRQHGLFPGQKGKGSLSTLLNDLICEVDLQNDLTVIPGAQRSLDSARRLALSGWAVSVVIGLCSDTIPAVDQKEQSEGLSTVRKTVLDVIAKALKDTVGQDLSSRYGRLWAIGELIYGLLLAKPSIVPRQQDESSLEIAKAMLEKNFVSLLTAAISDIDLNFPDVRNVLVSLLRALEHL